MLEKQPDDPFLNYALAMEWLKEGSPVLAIQQFDRTISLDSGYLGAYFQKANTLVGEGRTADARTTLQSGIDAARKKQDSHAADEMKGLLDSLE